MALASGFEKPVADAQACFRAIMDAVSRPGLVRSLPSDIRPPSPLTPELAALALALADPEAPLWIDRELARSGDARDFLRFHTGAPIVENPQDAAFALVSTPAEMPPLAAFAQGSDAYPDRSTTVVVAVHALEPGGPIVVAGPGVKGEARLAIEPRPANLVEQLGQNQLQFPRGVDLIFVAHGRIAALPRSSRVEEAV